MQNIDSLAASLREAVTNFLVPLQTTRVVKPEAFEVLHNIAKDLMREFVGTDKISKSLLNEIYVTVLTMKAEAPYFDGHKEQLEEMANALEMCFSLILKNEVPEDRVPGVPRII